MTWHHVLCLNCQGRFQRLTEASHPVGYHVTAHCPLCDQLAPGVVTSPPKPPALCEHCGADLHPSDMHWIYEAYVARSHSRT